MLIRQAEARDYREVYELVKEAFIAAEHADGNEQDLVEALRKGGAFIPKLSLVAEIDGKLAGYILFTKAVVGRNEVLVLAPVAVKPAYQKPGIGAALINEGHENLAMNIRWYWEVNYIIRVLDMFRLQALE